MKIKNITDKGAPKPIGIGNVVIMPGEMVEVPDDIAYINEFDKAGKKTGRKIILPAIILLSGMNQIVYEETKKVVEKAVDKEEAEEVVEAAPKKTTRRSKKAE